MQIHRTTVHAQVSGRRIHFFQQFAMSIRHIKPGNPPSTRGAQSNVLSRIAIDREPAILPAITTTVIQLASFLPEVILNLTGRITGN